MMIADTTNLTESGPLAGLILAFPSWAKTQESIALNAFQGTNDIWVIDLADPGNPVNITHTSGYEERMPSWAPDDSRLAFRRASATNTKEKASVFTMSADGSAVTDIGQPTGGSSPDWRRCCPTCATVCAP